MSLGRLSIFNFIFARAMERKHRPHTVDSGNSSRGIKITEFYLALFVFELLHMKYVRRPKDGSNHATQHAHLIFRHLFSLVPIPLLQIVRILFSCVCVAGSLTIMESIW